MEKKENTGLWLYKKLYPVVIVVIAILNLIFLNTFKNKWGKFAKYLWISTFFWYLWTFVINNWTVIPCWTFAKYAVTSIQIMNVTLEDLLFYPVCCTFFLIILLRIDKDTFTREDETMKYVMIIVAICFTMWDVVGATLSGMIFLPTTLWYKHFSNKTFFKMVLLFMPLSIVWELHSHTLKPYLFGLAEWYYPRESGLFNKNIWFGNTPLSITPYFMFLGFYFNYVLYTLTFRNKT